ncbi:hypothetical protein PT974_10807 [Cladobotryum mycophilum]|uniref:DUF7514 domain-containing protein n=1 Tax=Cladobotryum mycophilum TaxID=491253 RepID=A0ABR0SAU8_9HYPO
MSSTKVREIKGRKAQVVDVHKSNTKPSVQQKEKRGQSSSSPSSSSPLPESFLLSKLQKMTGDLVSSMNTTTATTKKMGKKQVDDVVRGLEEWNAKWFEELVSKVKGELAQSTEDGSHSVQSLSSDEVLTPQSRSNSSSPKSSTFKPYQSTVEDDPEDDYFLVKGLDRGTAFERPSPSTQTSYSSTSSSPTSSTSSYSYGATPLPNHPSSSSPRAPQQHHLILPIQLLKPDLPAKPISAPERSSTEPALSAVDAKWGRLFNDKNEPTPALGRFLRGIANYIIAEYTPTDSHVITPEKLDRFYSKYKLEGEVFPFQRFFSQGVFDTHYQKTHRGLEFLYLDLRCEHHLVQSNPGSRPSIPALTPAGFEDWMTLLIRASPDREARRLDLIVADLPIVADGPSGVKPERLPRQISRHLFPDRCHAKAYDLLTSSFTEWCRIAAPPDLGTHSVPSSLRASPPASSRTHRDERRRYKDETTESTPHSRSSHRTSSSYKVYDRGSGSSSKHPRESRYHESSRRSREKSPPVTEKYHRSKRYREVSPRAEERRNREDEYRRYGHGRRSTS